MHPATIIGTFRLLIVDVAMGQIPRSTERISSFLANQFYFFSSFSLIFCYGYAPLRDYSSRGLGDFK